MNLAVDVRFSKDEFLLWVQGQERRCELKDGRVMMMAGGSLGHARTYTALAGALMTRLPLDRWSVTVADVAVAIGADIRYPDVMVERYSGTDNSALFTSQPVFIGEVLSPSTADLDFSIKAQEYMSLSSLQAYLVSAQDEPRVWLWERQQDGTFHAEARQISGFDESIALTCFGAQVPMGEIFRWLPRDRTDG